MEDCLPPLASFWFTQSMISLSTMGLPVSANCVRIDSV